MDCPHANRLAAFVEGTLLETELEALTDHLLDCAPCRRVVVALKRSDASIPLPRVRRWNPLAAAAALLLAVSLWGWMHARKEAPLPPDGARPAPPADVPILPLLAEARAPACIWLAPGSRIQVREGSVSRTSDARLALSGGEVWIEHRVNGPLEVSTPAGMVRAQGPWVARVCCRPLSGGSLTEGVRTWLLPVAEAATSPELLIEVHEGKAELAQGQGKPPTPVQAGERLHLSPDGTPRVESFPLTAPEGLRVWRGPELAALLGTPSLRLEGGTTGRAWPLPLPQGQPCLVELKLRTLSPVSRLGLAIPVGNALRLWQLSGTDCAGEEIHTVSLAVLGASASGCVDGNRLWSVREALGTLQPVEAPAGLRIWGDLEVLELRIRTWEGGTGGS